MTFEEFEAVVEESLAALPAEFREILEREEIRVIARERVPGPLRKAWRGSIVFGVFVGVPYGHLVDVHHEPTRIELYKDSFEKEFDAPEEIRQQILNTVVHEVAHYFGFSEKEIRKLGY